ncbi:hypothetical protein [Allokutzneria oryzae]|uniref:Mce-associated membrane protein n=1 Tax=Allokutzneria oryzae TaxID=1378989 RepID=A0ABV6A300_9PSEU
MRAEPEPEPEAEVTELEVGAEPEAKAEPEPAVTGELEPEAEVTGLEVGAEPEAKAERAGGRWWVVVVVLAVVGGWFGVEAVAVRTGPANQALIDRDATTRVSDAVTEAVATLFSYRFDGAETFDRSTWELLRGNAVGQHERLFAQIRQQAPAQRLVLTSKVVRTGVRALEGDRAVLLVFLDQTLARGDNGTTSAAAAQLTVTTERVDGRWRVTDLQPR